MPELLYLTSWSTLLHTELIQSSLDLILSKLTGPVQRDQLVPIQSRALCASYFLPLLLRSPSSAVSVFRMLLLVWFITLTLPSDSLHRRHFHVLTLRDSNWNSRASPFNSQISTNQPLLSFFSAGICHLLATRPIQHLYKQAPFEIFYIFRYSKCSVSLCDQLFAF